MRVAANIDVIRTISAQTVNSRNIKYGNCQPFNENRYCTLYSHSHSHVLRERT